MTGGVSNYPGDQLQYLSFARDLSHGALAADHFTIPASRPVYLEPVFALSGMLVRAGMDIRWGEVVWQPVAAITMTASIVWYCRRTVDGRMGQAIAALLALFAVNPIVALGHWTGLSDRLGFRALDDMASEMLTVGGLWGYAPAALAVGLMPALFLLVERALAKGRSPRRRTLVAPAVVGLLISWLHPWQGAVSIAVLVGLVMVERRRAAIATVVPVTIALVAPITYYATLSRLDSAWEVAAASSDVPLWAARIVVLGLLPLGLPALVGGHSAGALGVQGRMLRLWPVATFAVYVAHPTSANHVVEGLSIPLSVLAVRGWQVVTGSRRPDPRAPTTTTVRAAGATAAALAVCALVIPGAVESSRTLADIVASGSEAHYMTADDFNALRWLEGRPSGGVVTGVRLSTAVPALTGDPVWSGHPAWTPDLAARNRADEALLSGGLGAAAARTFLSTTGARYVWADCEYRTDLATRLPGLLIPVGRFGCSSIYVVNTTRTGG